MGVRPLTTGHDRQRSGPGRRSWIVATARGSPSPAVSSPVTIVVGTRNRRSMPAASLRRHLALPERPQVIVVDDASTDGTPAMLHQAFPGVQHIRLPSSLG